MANPTELASKLPTPALGSRKLLSTRRGTIALAALAALAALGVLVLFMSNYRASVNAGTVDTRVLVADTFIDRGTSGDVIAEAGLFKPATINEDEALDGAITDLSAITGQVATEPIYRGQQLTAASFAPGSDPVTGRLEGTQRALTLPIDEAKGSLDQLKTGSRVDILGGFEEGVGSGDATEPLLDVLARDVLVLEVPAQEGGIGSSGSHVVLRVTDAEAGRIAFAADRGEMWLTVRPPTLAKDSNTGPVQLESLLGQD